MCVNQSGGIREPIAVIGGGVSGLAAAHQIRSLAANIDVVLLEAATRVGGVLETEHRDGLLIERSADMFTTKDPAAIVLAERLGMVDRLIPTNEARRGAKVVRQGRLESVPKGFVLLRPTRWKPIWNSSLLSPFGKLRMLTERFVPGRNLETDESLRSFVVRRFGKEAFERLVQPLIGGIYTADPEKLSMQATMSEFVEMERRFGRLTSLPRRAEQELNQGAEATAEGARYGAFLAPRGGMQELIDRLVESIGEHRIHYGRQVTRVEPALGGGWLVWNSQRCSAPTRYRAVIVATPAHHASRLLQAADATLAGRLASIPYAGVAIAVLCYRRKQLQRYAPCFGLVAPAIEKRHILAASFASEKFPGRAHEDEVLIRVFLGGALQASLLQRSDEELLNIAMRELSELIGAAGPPRLADLIRWPTAMPQYHLGHRTLVRDIQRRVAEHPGLELAGNAYDGVGIPACIHSGQDAASRVLQGLQAHTFAGGWRQPSLSR